MSRIFSRYYVSSGVRVRSRDRETKKPSGVWFFYVAGRTQRFFVFDSRTGVVSLLGRKRKRVII